MWWYVGDEGAGLFFLALTCRNVATAFGKGGLERVLVRTIAARAATDDIAGIHSAREFAMRCALRRSLLVALTLAALAWPLAHVIFDKPMTSLLVLMALTVLPATMVSLGCAALRGLKHIAASQFIDSVSGPLLACGLLPIFATLFGVEGAAIGRGLALICAAVCAMLVWQRVAPSLGGQTSDFDSSVMTQASPPLLQTDLMNLLMTSLPMLLLGVYWQEASEAGIYGIALRTAMLIAFIQMGLNAILGPKFAAMWELQQLDELRTLARKACWLAFAAALPFAALFCLAPVWVLSMFGESATAGALALTLLTLSQLVNVASGPVGSLLVMSGHQELVRNSTMATVLLQLSLCFWLIPSYGAVGAAITAAAGVATKNLINVLMVRKHLGVRLLSWG